MLINPPQRGHQPHDQAFARHFHAEHRDRTLHLNRRIFDDVHRQRGFAHGGPASDHDQIAALQAGRFLVEIRPARGNAGDGVVALEQDINPLDRARQQVLDAGEALPNAGPPLGDREHPLLGIVQQLPGIAAPGIVGAVGDFGAGADQLAANRPLADDVGIGADVGGAGRIPRQHAQIDKTPGFLQLVVVFQPLRQRQQIERLAVFGQTADGTEQQPVIVAVEIALVQPVRHLIPGGVIQHQAAQHGLFGFE